MDDKRKRGQPDRSLINTHETYELRYWSEKFGVTEEKLKQTVHKVGTSAKAVEKALGR